MTYDLVVKGGTVVSASDTFVADIGVANGRVAAVGRLDLPARHILDARGKLVLPGGIDSLTDLEDAAASLLAGTTTLIELLPQTLSGSWQRTLAARLRGIGKCCPADYAFHLNPCAPCAKKELTRLEAAGIPALDASLWRDLRAGIAAQTDAVPRFFGLWDAVQRGTITENRFVELTAAAPARLFGLYPRKGHLNAGADADIVVIDPNKTHACKGRTVKGSIRDVLVRGTAMVKDGKWVGRTAHGKFLRRVPQSFS